MFVLKLLTASPQTWRGGEQVEVGEVVDSVVLPVLPPVTERGIKVEVHNSRTGVHRTYSLSGEPVFVCDAAQVAAGLSSDLQYVEWYVRETVPSEERNAADDARPESSRSVYRFDSSGDLR